MVNLVSMLIKQLSKMIGPFDLILSDCPYAPAWMVFSVADAIKKDGGNVEKRY